MSRHEEKSFTNVHGVSEKGDVAMEEIVSHVPGWAQNGGAFDASDIAYMRTQSEAKRQAEIDKLKAEESALMRFRLNSMQSCQAKTETIIVPAREKRQVKNTMQVKIKSKKRRTDSKDNDTIGEAGPISDVSTIAGGGDEDVGSSKQTAAVTTSGALGLLAAVYSDSE